VPSARLAPAALAAAAVLVLLLAGPVAAFWILTGLAVVGAAVAALTPAGHARPAPPAAPADPAAAPARDADLATTLTL
jgi:hypothetical protein